MKHLLKCLLLISIVLLLVGCGPEPDLGTEVDELSIENAFIDLDEWRDNPVRHRFVSGGFTGTDTRFSMYFPPEEQYEGRFFQPLQATSGNENTAPEAMAQTVFSIDFAIDSGAYLVESNQGRKNMFVGDDPTLTSYRASAAVAEFSRLVAQEMYGPHRPYGYVFGGSGGSLRTLSCLENTEVWDGGVPFVIGSPVSIPSAFTVQAHAMRILWDKFPAIVDALEPGGSGDMFSGLNEEERAALSEVTHMGFPPRAWFNYERIALGYTGVFSVLMDAVIAADQTYLEDFWTVPGYLGADNPEPFLAARVTYDTSIARLIMPAEARAMGIPLMMPVAQTETGVEFPAALVLESVPEGNLRGAALSMKSGAAEGHKLYTLAIIGNIPALGNLVLIGFGEKHFEAMAKLAVGDELTIDNSDYLAMQTYHRHQNVTPDFYVWDYFRGPDGEPLFPQRPVLQQKGGLSVAQDGHFTGKVIVVQALWDESAYPWKGDWYRSQVKNVLGNQLDDRFRLWYVDNTMHTSPVVSPNEPKPVITTRIVSYQGALQQALRYLIDWVEKGIAPPSSSNYMVEGGQVFVPSAAAERNGIQPVVTLTVDGGAHIEVAVGEPVEFSAIIEVPPGAGYVVAAEWDFEGTGAYPLVEEFDSRQPRVTLTTTYTFSEPGTYFPALRASSQRPDDFGTIFGRAQNLGRVRVVVR